MAVNEDIGHSVCRGPATMAAVWTLFLFWDCCHFILFSLEGDGMFAKKLLKWTPGRAESSRAWPGCCSSLVPAQDPNWMAATFLCQAGTGRWDVELGETGWRWAEVSEQRLSHLLWPGEMNWSGVSVFKVRCRVSKCPVLFAAIMKTWWFDRVSQTVSLRRRHDLNSWFDP